MGAVLALIPRFAPGLCSSTGADGSSARTIWLQLMSFVQMGLGLAYFARRSLAGLASLLEYSPQLALATAEVRPAQQPAFPRPALNVQALSPIHAAIESGLLDQRRAA